MAYHGGPKRPHREIIGANGEVFIEKQCCTCEAWLTFEHFHNSKSTWDHKSARCKPCARTATLSSYRDRHFSDLKRRQGMRLQVGQEENIGLKEARLEQDTFKAEYLKSKARQAARKKNGIDA